MAAEMNGGSGPATVGNKVSAAVVVSERLRFEQRIARSNAEMGRALSGSLRRDRSSSSATCLTAAYRPLGSRSMRLRQIVAISRGA